MSSTIPISPSRSAPPRSSISVRPSFPILTPLAFDPGRPFPHISNLSLNLAVVIADATGAQHFARVKAPESLPQVVSVTRARTGSSADRARTDTYVWLEQMIAANLDALFPGMKVLESHPFHVTRDADIDINELEAEDLLETIEEGVRQRRFGSVIRLEVHHEMPRPILNLLMQNMEINSKQVYRRKGLLGLCRLMSLYQIDRSDLKYKTFVPRFRPTSNPPPKTTTSLPQFGATTSWFTIPSIRSSRWSISSRKPRADPDVLAIKIVLYRVGRNSPVVQALLDASKRASRWRC